MDEVVRQMNQTKAAGRYKEIDLKEWLVVIRQRWKMVILPIIIFGILGGYLNSIPEEPVYAASARIFIAADSRELLGTLKVLVKEPVVLNDVIEKLNLDETPGSLRDNISVNSVDTSLVTVIGVRSSQPQLAADIANEVVQSFKAKALETINFPNIKLLTRAEAVPYPINPESNSGLYIAIVLGVIVGIGLAFFVNSLDDSVRDKQEVEDLLQVRVLGEITKARRKDFITHKDKEAPIRGESLGS